MHAEYGHESITVDGHPIRVLAERGPGRPAGGRLGADFVIESTGRTDRDNAALHLKGGAKKV